MGDRKDIADMSFEEFFSESKTKAEREANRKAAAAAEKPHQEQPAVRGFVGATPKINFNNGKFLLYIPRYRGLENDHFELAVECGESIVPMGRLESVKQGKSRVTRPDTLDLTPPVTTMAETNYVVSESAMRVTFSAADEASGVQSYLLFVSEDGSEYSYCGQSTVPVMDYPVASENGHTYSFFVLAIDNVGNTERIQPQTVEGVATGITTVSTKGVSELRIYTTDGRYVGSDPTRLTKGVYVIGGAKFVVK